jgi:FtsP/CotA-like multicopper oxidase with cupredoxin domain
MPAFSRAKARIGEQQMKLRSFAARAQMALCALLSGCAAVPSAPGPVRVPADQELLRQLHATGVQVYQCQPSKNDASQWEWSFKQPEANLSNKMGRNVGKHYGGPTWEANDGSRVTGEVIARSESPKPNSIPLLLLRARSSSGHGIFTGVNFIQRLNTVGGNAPTVACRKEQAGQELRASYTADYLFYGVKR